MVRVDDPGLGSFRGVGTLGLAAGPAATAVRYRLRDVLYGFEAWKNHSNHLHWPGGSSGVTLGPGYDMRQRTRQEIFADLTAIGIDRKSAEEVAPK